MVAESSEAPKVLIPLAPEGSEELEFCSISNPLRRAGAEVTVAAIGDDLQVKCARGIVLISDWIILLVSKIL